MYKIQRLLSLTLIFICIFPNINAQGDSLQPRVFPRIIHSIKGKITDLQNGNPLAGASIYIPDFKRGTVSNNDGSFFLTRLAPGRHLVEVSYVGYGTITEYINIAGDVQKDFTLSPAIIENNEVVVTGVTTASQLSRSPIPISIIKREELIGGVSINVIDALSRKPGMAQLSTGPAISKPFIRGLGYNRVVVINDGVRQEGQQWGDEHGIEIDEYSINKVEILKGAASLMYGSDAIAGVINILTNVPVAEGTIRGNIMSNYQTNNRLRGAGFNMAGNNSGFNWSVWGSYKAAADYKNKFDDRVFNSKFNERNFGGYIGYNGNWGYSHFIVSNFNQNAGIVEGDRDSTGKFLKLLAGGVEANPVESDFNSLQPQIPRQKINHFKLTTDNSFNAGTGRLALNLGYQKNKRMEFGNADDPEEKELFFDLNTITYSLIYHASEKRSWRTSIGINGMQQTNKNKGEEVLIPEYSLFDIGGFVFTQKNFSDLTLTGGVRFDNRFLDSKFLQDGTDIKFNPFKKNFSNISASAGISRKISKLVTLKFNIARGFRAPTIAELASNGTHEGTNRYEYGDQNLKSETSLQLDGGFELNSEHLSLTATFFKTVINNFIFYRKLQTPSGLDSTVKVDNEFIPAFQFNQQKANLAGLEINFDIHPHPLDWLHFENTFSYVRGKFNQPIDGSDNLPLIPAARLISELHGVFFENGKLFRNVSLKLEMDNTFTQKKFFAGYDTETATPGYTLWNSGISFDLVSKQKTLFNLYFNIINMGDVAYQSHLSRLKYAAENVITGRRGVFNAGRNFSIKLNVPLSFSKNAKAL